VYEGTPRPLHVRSRQDPPHTEVTSAENRSTARGKQDRAASVQPALGISIPSPSCNPVIRRRVCSSAIAFQMAAGCGIWRSFSFRATVYIRFWRALLLGGGRNGVSLGTGVGVPWRIPHRQRRLSRLVDGRGTWISCGLGGVDVETDDVVQLRRTAGDAPLADSSPPATPMPPSLTPLHRFDPRHRYSGSRGLRTPRAPRRRTWV